MKLVGSRLLLATTTSTCLFLATAWDGGSTAATFRPLRVSYEDLLSGRYGGVDVDPDFNVLLEALTSVGMISITDMPPGFRQLKQEVLASIPSAAAHSALAKEHVFDDGTRRRTLATHTLPGGTLQAMNHRQHHSSDADPDVVALTDFERSSAVFRKEVNQATGAFSRVVGDLLGTAPPLLNTKEGFEFASFADVVENGEHLEHFHEYQYAAGSSSSSLLKKDKGNPNVDLDVATLEWHTDQGLFLVFSPGTVVQEGQGKDPLVLGPTEGFYIEMPDGSRPQLQLDEEDELVIILGDGVNQYINSRSQRKLRALPHALFMPPLAKHESRVWYGRMVLPPQAAIHPQHGLTFGQIRERLIQASTSPQNSNTKSNSKTINKLENDHTLSLGCSSPSLQTRQLETSSCEEGTLLCWHRCMSLGEHNVPGDTCAQQGLDLRCVNPRGQLWDETHGDW